MPMIHVRDTQLYVERAQGAGPPLVFVHGMCGGAWVWADQVKRLSDRFTCIAYDRRGHSRSSSGEADQSVGTHADDLAALIDTLGLDKPLIVASSGGAAVTVEFMRGHPGRIRGALLSEPPLASISSALGAELYRAIEGPVQSALRSRDPVAALEAFLGVVCPGLWERLDEERRSRYRHNAPLLLPTLETPTATVSLDDVRTIEEPVVVVSGTESPAFIRNLARLLADTLPQGRLVELRGASHATYVDAPEAFARTVVETSVLAA